MSRQALSIAMTMLVCFSISFAIMWRQHKAEEAVSVPEATSSAVAPVPTRPPVAQRREPTMHAAPAPAPAPARVSAAAAAAAPVISGSPDEEAPPQALPVAFHLWNRRNLHKIEGNITNVTNRPLSITMRAVNPATQQSSEAQLQFAPGEKKTFSSDDGLLNMHSGDQLILQSPPYEDRVSRIP